MREQRGALVAEHSREKGKARAWAKTQSDMNKLIHLLRGKKANKHIIRLPKIRLCTHISSCVCVRVLSACVFLVTSLGSRVRRGRKSDDKERINAAPVHQTPQEDTSHARHCCSFKINIFFISIKCQMDPFYHISTIKQCHVMTQW